MAAATASPKSAGAKPRRTHRTRAEINDPLTFGERIADSAARVVGSWRFIIIQTILVIIWIAFNAFELGFGRFDPFPFVLLNLMFSVQAAYTGPILLLAGNRQAARDRAIAQRDDEEVGVIYRLQHEQMEILSLLKEANQKHTEILEMLRGSNDRGDKPRPS